MMECHYLAASFYNTGLFIKTACSKSGLVICTAIHIFDIIHCYNLAVWLCYKG